VTSNLNLLTALLAGLVSFLSPCVLPLIPGYISFISGLSLQELRTPEAASQATRRAFLSSVWFVLGFSVVFVALGASATVLGSLLLPRLGALRIVAGAIIIIFGLHLTGIFRIPFLQYEKKVEVRQRPLTAVGAFLVGAAFAFGWTPCIGPILAGILALASTQETIGQGMLLLAAYSLGLGVPFLAASLGVQAFLRFFGRFKGYLRAVEIASGLLLIGVGVLIMADRLTLLSRYLTFFKRFAL
jgi:cytochrome c-type biogenesis protein